MVIDFNWLIYLTAGIYLGLAILCLSIAFLIYRLALVLKPHISAWKKKSEIAKVVQKKFIEPAAARR